MSKPIQICLSCTRQKNAHTGDVNMLVLCDDGRIFKFEEAVSGFDWEEVKGPWMEEVNS